MEGNFSNFKKILSNFNSAFIIQFGYFWAMIFQFLALIAQSLTEIFFFYKIGVKWCFVVFVNSLLLPEHYLTPWVFIWSHASAYTVCSWEMGHLEWKSIFPPVVICEYAPSFLNEISYQNVHASIQTWYLGHLENFD